MNYYLSVPDSVIEKIREHSKDEEQQRHECIHYYLKYSPYSMLGWGYLGGELYYWGREEAVLTATRAFIQRVSGTIYMCLWHDIVYVRHQNLIHSITYDHDNYSYNVMNHACSNVHNSVNVTVLYIHNNIIVHQ